MAILKNKVLFFTTSPRTPSKSIPEIKLLIDKFVGRKWDPAPCGYGVDGKQRNQFKSYKPEPGMTPKQIEKELTRQAVLFEEECKRGQITSAVKFEKFAEQWFEEYAKVNLRPTSYARMK